MTKPISERALIFLVGAVQFVNILDFMMVMPLGPDFATALGIPLSKIGTIGGSYTAAAAVSGLLGSVVLDRFDRRTALALAMLGLVIGTAAGALATGLWSLLAARVVAGFFGGPATSLSFSIIADAIPAERRGKALGAVMGAFSIASILGVPAGLELARGGRWWLPFIAVAGVGAVVTFLAIRLIPPMRGHLDGGPAQAVQSPDFFKRPLYVASWAMTALVMMSGFIVIPNLSSYMQYNLGYPRDGLGQLYLVGGAVSFFSMRLVGALVDRYGAYAIGTIGSLLVAMVTGVWFVCYLPGVPMLVLFPAFMVAMSFRNVSYNTLASRVPRPSERARFMSIQSAVQHLAAAAGSFLSAELLLENPDKSLDGIATVGIASMALTLALPPLMRHVERRLAT